jgi:pyruvate kinase
MSKRRLRLLEPETLRLRAPAKLLGALRQLRADVAADGENTLQRWQRPIARHAFKLGAANLAHYLALRRRDLRDLQDQLTLLGLSSLGRLEARVLPNLDAAIAALAPQAGEQAPFPSPRAFYRGGRLLERNSAELFGQREPRRRAIMVTLGTDAAEDADLILDLARRGMDVARINGAHDTADLWARMVANVRRAGQLCGRDLRILFDLAGPACRTGDVMLADRGRLKPGDRLMLVGGPLSDDGSFPNQASCTLPEALHALAPGHGVWFDDGKLQGEVEEVRSEGALVRVLRTGPKGAKLKPEKGLIFPDTDLALDPLMPDDLAALDFAVGEVDMIGYSFVQRPEDVACLQQEMAARRADWRRLGLIAKVETRQAIHNLPEIIVQAARWQPFGVMIARGDLAVGIGFARLAEMQEELLWLCEAAHVPVVWATEVLETLRKKGTFARGEMTDAAMAARAECVMLNKGPYVGEAIDVLQKLFARMGEHQNKKTPRLRALHAWDREGNRAADAKGSAP